MSVAAVQNLTGDYEIEQGSKFVLPLQIQHKVNGVMVNYDFTNRLARAQLRESYDSQTPAITFDVTILSPETDGKVVIEAGATVTAAVEPGNYVWDLESYDSGDADDVKRLVKGKATVSPEVTK